jgi:hypothetical protein
VSREKHGRELVAPYESSIGDGLSVVRERRICWLLNRIMKLVFVILSRQVKHVEVGSVGYPNDGKSCWI